MRAKPLKNLQIPSRKPPPKPSQPIPNLSRWDPFAPSPPRHVSPSLPLSVSSRISPIARFILDAFRIHKSQWGPPLIAELQKLRRVTPNLLTEVLKHQTNPTLATRFFHWTGRQKGYRHTYASYNALAYCLSRANLPRAADNLPELMHSLGDPPTEKQFEILIRLHSLSNRGLRVYYIYQKMNKFGIRPRVFLYNRVMESLIKCGHLDLALSVYRDFLNDGLKEESVTFMVLIKGLCNHKRVDEALDLLRKMKRELCKPDVFAYTAMIKILVREGDVNGCVKIWREMENDGIEPDAKAYATFVYGLCKGGFINEGLGVLKRMKSRGVFVDRVVYEIVIEGFVKKEKNVDKGIELFREMISCGYAADLKMYNVIIEGLCEAKRVELAHHLVKSAVKTGLGPNFETVSPLLQAYAEMERMTDFNKLITQMKSLRFPISNNLVDLIQIILDKEDITSLFRILDYVKQNHLSSVAIYNLMMQWSVSRGEFKRSLEFLKEMRELGLEPDGSSLSTAIVCEVELGGVEVALRIREGMRGEDWVPTAEAYGSLAKGLAVQGEIAGAMAVVRECLWRAESGPMEFKYALRVRAACKGGKAEDVVGVMEEMVEEGGDVGEVICASVVAGMSVYGTVDEGRRVFGIMKERGISKEPLILVFEDILYEYSKDGRE